jgi:hypothetical protein
MCQVLEIHLGAVCHLILDASLWILDIEKDRFRILSPQGGTYASLKSASPLMRDFRFVPTGIEHPASRSLVGFPASVGTGRRSFAIFLTVIILYGMRFRPS